MNLLRAFAAQPGDLLSKEEIIAIAWNGSAIADSVLTSTIAELRQLLNDDAQHPRYIQTIPKRGYRLVADVGAAVAPQAAGGVADTAAPPRASAAAAPPTDSPARRAERTVPALPGVRPAGWTLSFATGAIGTLVLAASLALHWIPSSRAAAPDSGEMRLPVVLPDGVRLETGNTPRIALSPDGSRLAYVARAATGSRLYVRALNVLEATPLEGTEGACAPAFSPSGARIAFFTANALNVIPVSGGRAIPIAAVSSVMGAAWRDETTLVFGGAYRSGLQQIGLAGGMPTSLTTVDSEHGELAHRWPDVLPDGRTLLFTVVRADTSDVFALDLTTGARRLVLGGAAFARFVPPDRLVFGRDGKLYANRIDPSSLNVIGSPALVADDLRQAPNNAVSDFAVARSGALAYVRTDPGDLEGELLWVDAEGRTTPVKAPLRPYMHPRLSPDERQVLTWLRGGDEDLWSYDFGSSRLNRIVSGVAAHRADWSPHGDRIVFDAPRQGQPISLFTMPTMGGRAEPLGLPVPGTFYSSGWSSDDRQLALVRATPSTGFDVLILDTRTGTLTPLLTTPANETAPRFSPGGAWLAYVSNETGRNEIYMLNLSEHTRVRVSTNGGREPVWSRTGDELFFRNGDGMLAVRVTPGWPVRISAPDVLFTGRFDERPSWRPNYDVSMDGRFLMVRARSSAATASLITVLLNWREKP